MISPLYIFDYYLKNVIWGGSKISDYKNITLPGNDIGECWEISGIKEHESSVIGGDDSGLLLSELIAKYGEKLVGKETYARYGNYFPILIKILDTCDKLSFQVHPGEELAMSRHNCHGKTELWYVVKAADDALIHAGFNTDLTFEEYKNMVDDGSITRVINSFNPKEGEVFYIKPGTVHAIGAGNLLIEVQQTSDITYRIYDYRRRDKDGNLRELHTELACDAINYKSDNGIQITPQTLSDDTRQLINCNYFNVKKIDISDSKTMDFSARDCFTIIMSIDSDFTIEACGKTENLSRGHAILVSAFVNEVTLKGSGSVLAVTMPE